MPGVNTATTRRSDLHPLQNPTQKLASQTMPTAADPHHAEATDGPSYYNISLLQAPVWKWEIALYFWFGGISGGSYVLGRMAERFGGGRYRDLSRLASYISFVSLLPSPPLLIYDLGDPKRFHHMLRVFKPSTPMSLGSWILSGYSLPCTAEAMRQFTLDRLMTAKQRARFEASTVNKAITATNDLACVPLALGLAGYTGVLLSCASTPLWCKNTWIGPLFSSSAAATAASAVNLALDLTGADLHGPSKRAVERIDTVAHVTEAVMLAGFLKQAGPLARPMTHGRQRTNLWLTIAGIVGAELIKALPLRGKPKRAASILASLLSLAGGLALRWAFVYGGQESGGNPRDARLGSKPKPPTEPAGSAPQVAAAASPTTGEGTGLEERPDTRAAF
jgi:formate-dependent nitrite reductase membrane component NrfD